MEKMQETFITDPFSRFLKISSMASKVGLSFLGNKTISLFLGKESSIANETEFCLKNGPHILETPGSEQ